MGLWTFMIKTCFRSNSLWWSKNWIGFKWPTSLAVILFFKFVSFMSEQISFIKSLLYLSSRRAVLDQPPIACRSFLTEVFSLFAKTLDTAMIRRNTWNRYLLFASCVLLLAGPFSQNFGYNDKEEILDTDICYLRPAYYCLQVLSYRRFLSLPKLRI